MLSQKSRFLHVMLVFYERLGYQDETGKPVFELPIQRSDIASLIGAQPETISRLIQKVQREGLLHFDSKRVMFTDMDAVLHELKKAVRWNRKVGERRRINCHHNYTAQENHHGQNIWVTRKGAVSARADELGIIPGSMGARSYIVRGKGNAQSFHSCAHGAGRAMSRTEPLGLAAGSALPSVAT